MSLIQISDKHVINTDFIEAIEKIVTKNETIISIKINGISYKIKGTDAERKAIWELILKHGNPEKSIKQFNSV